jgi:hypothetical protein
VHLHALVLDGVLARGDAGTLAFHPIGRLTLLDVEEVLATVEPLVGRRLWQRGLAGDDGDVESTDGWADEAPVLAGLAAASVEGVAAVGPRRGVGPVRLGIPREPVEPSGAERCHARVNGFDLDAGLVVPAGRREWLERVCRYVLRSPVAAERLEMTADGRVRLSLKQPRVSARRDQGHDQRAGGISRRPPFDGVYLRQTMTLALNAPRLSVRTSSLIPRYRRPSRAAGSQSVDPPMTKGSPSPMRPISAPMLL